MNDWPSQCNHCNEIFGSIHARGLHRKDNPLKAKCLSPNSMRKTGMWRGFNGIWWAKPEKSHSYEMDPESVATMRVVEGKNRGGGTYLHPHPKFPLWNDKYPSGEIEARS